MSDYHEFRECDTCAAKPGSPYLCKGCLANRAAIGVLTRGGLKGCPLCRSAAAGPLLGDEASALLVEALENATGWYEEVVGELDRGIECLRALITGLQEGRDMRKAHLAGHTPSPKEDDK